MSNLGRLTMTMFLELLNMDGDDNQKTESNRMSDRVAKELEKNKGMIASFEHENRATLKLAITL